MEEKLFKSNQVVKLGRDLRIGLFIGLMVWLELERFVIKGYP
jgi:hypothetical protein